MKKKLIAGMTSAAVIASLSAPAFAANFGDVKGAGSESAAGLLKALGVLNGDVNGNFNPNATITRAEFAKIAVKVAGLGAAADAYGTAAATGFNDVPAGHWAAGYVAVAKAAGLVKGYDQWNFAPNENVTYEQVLAVVERILGYNDNLPGAYPSGYVVKGAALGLTKNTQFQAGKPATRGDVAIMSRAALDKFVVSYSKDTNAFTETSDNLISKSFSNTIKTLVLTETEKTQGTALEAGKIKLGAVSTNAGSVNGVTAITTYDLAADAVVVGDAEALKGHEVKAVFNSDGKVSFLADASNTIKSGLLKTAGSVVANFTFDGDSSATTIGANAVFFFNGQPVANNDARVTSVSTSATVTVVKDDNGVAIAVFVDQWDVSHAQVEAVQVGTTTTTLSYKVFTAPASTSIVNVTIPSTAKVTRDGQVVAASALTKGDAVFINKLAGDSSKAAVVDAYSKTVTGNLDKTYIGNDAIKVTVAGTDYTVDTTMVNVAGLTIGNQVTLLLDGKNKVKQVTNVTGATNQVVGYLEKLQTNVLKANTDGTYSNVTRYTFFTKDGQTVVKDQPVSDYTYAGGSHTLVENNFYDVTFDSKGVVTTKDNDVATTGSLVSGVSSVNKTFAAGGTYQVASSTVFIDASKTDADGKVVGALTSFDKLANGGSVKVVSANGVTADYVIVKNFGTQSSDAKPNVNGIVSNVYTTRVGSDSVTSVVLNVNGATQTVDLFKNVALSANAGDMVSIVDGGGDGSYDVASNVYTDAYKVTVTSPVDADKTFTDGAGSTYYVDSNTIVYIVKASDASNAVSIGNYYDVKAATTVWAVKGTQYSTGKFHADAVMIRK